jgi:Ca-activated chloride channel family protein
MFRFGAPEWLLALLVVPGMVAAYWYAAWSRRNALASFGDSALMDRLSASVSMPARRAKAILRVTTVLLTVFALARPQFGTRVETVRSVGQDIMIAVDLSQSMMAEDVAPNRLERARLAIFRLMGQLNGDRIGLVAFAGTAFVQSPLTIDYSAAGLFLGAMHPDIMPVQGTDLGEAVRVSLDALDEGARDARILILVTDGEDHEDRFAEELARARASDVRVYVIVLGSTEGVPIPLYDEQGQRNGFLRDEDGSVVTTRLGEETLADFVGLADATVVRAGEGGTGFEDLLDDIASRDGEALDEQQITQFEEQYQIFLGLALLLLMAELVISERKPTREAWLGRFE